MLTIQHENLIQALLSGKYKSNKDAAISVGYSARSAKVSVSRLVNNPGFKAALDAERKRQSQDQPDSASAVESIESLRQQKLSLEVQLTEAKLQQVKLNYHSPELVKEREESRRFWLATVEYTYALALHLCREMGTEDAEKLTAGIGDRIERACILREVEIWRTGIDDRSGAGGVKRLWFTVSATGQPIEVTEPDRRYLDEGATDTDEDEADSAPTGLALAPEPNEGATL